MWHGLFHDAGTGNDVIVVDVRLPRTVLGLLVGTALGLAGAVMQALTRNPLAEPGLLGVNAGASAAVVSAISFLNVTSITGYVWFAFLGAGAISARVYVLGGSRGATPVRLALAGTAATAALALLIARPLNALEMGDETARALGARLTRTRVLAMVSVTLLCGAATAACGPIVFIGLMVPHLVRAITGPDLRWILPYAAVLSPVLLLVADWIATTAFGDRELPVGVVTGVVGGCYLLWLLVTERKAGRI